MADVPILPKFASDWNKNDTEKLSIFYKAKCCHAILDQHVRFTADLKEKANGIYHLQFSNLEQAFCKLMDTIFALKNDDEEQARLTEILANPGRRGDGDVEFLLRLLGDVERNYQHLSPSSQSVGHVAKATGVKKCYIVLVIKLLTSYQHLLKETINGIPPTEKRFEGLFLSFANIFQIPFSCGSQVRSLDIFGQKVRCEPDLLYEHSDPLDADGPTSISVVTVAEVKKYAPPKDNDKSGCSQRLGSAGAVAGSPEACGPSPKRFKVDVVEEDNVDLPDEIKGQHAAELLLELERSILGLDKEKGNKRRMLGLIVQATNVRLTCLEMTNEHFLQLKQTTYQQSITNQKAFIYYSRAYEMFNKEDRRELVHIMIALGMIGEKDPAKESRHVLPFEMLNGFLIPRSVTVTPTD